MKIYITRHGEAEGNVRKTICGMSEGLLTNKGREEAEMLSEMLYKDIENNKIKRIYSSPLQRAVDTSNIIGSKLNVPVYINDLLHEMDFGELEGKSKDTPLFKRVKLEPCLRMPKGESLMDSYSRLSKFLDDISSLNENILIVSHGFMMRCVMAYFNSYSIDEFNSLEWGPCELRSFDL